MISTRRDAKSTSISIPGAAHSVDSKLNRVARLIRRRHQAAASTGKSSRAWIGPSELVVDRCHSGAWHAPCVLGLELCGRGHDQRDRPTFGRVVPGAVPALSLTSEEVPLFDGVVLGVVAARRATQAGATMLAVMPATTLMAASWAACFLWAALVAAAVMSTVRIASEAHPLAHDEARSEARCSDDDAFGNG